MYDPRLPWNRQHIATHRRSHRNPSRRYVLCTMARAENHENDKFSSWDVVSFKTYRDLLVIYAV